MYTIWHGYCHRAIYLSTIWGYSVLWWQGTHLLWLHLFQCCFIFVESLLITTALINILKQLIMRFEVFMFVKVLILVFWSIMSCCLAGGYQHNGITCCLKMKVIDSSGVLVITSNTAWYHISEDRNSCALISF